MTTNLPTDLGTTGPLAIATHALSKRFGRTTALAGVDLTVPEGAVYVLVGPNGAGKTTALQVLLDLVVADSGSAQVLGLDARRDGALVRAQLGYVPAASQSAYGWMTVERLLRYHAAYFSDWDPTYAAELTRLFEIRPDARVRALSSGHARRVELILALAHCPPVLVMDEPTNGLDPVVRETLLSVLSAHLARFPTTLLIATHVVHEVERLGDHLGVIRDGRIEGQFTRESLHKQLRSYRFHVPDEWPGAPALTSAVVRQSGSQREVAWTIWGDETEVSERLRATGAMMRQIQPLTLEAAALALLGRPPTAPERPAKGG